MKEQTLKKPEASIAVVHDPEYVGLPVELKKQLPRTHMTRFFSIQPGRADYINSTIKFSEYLYSQHTPHAGEK